MADVGQLNGEEVQHVLHTLATREEMEMLSVVGNLKMQMQEVASIFFDAEENSKVCCPIFDCEFDFPVSFCKGEQICRMLTSLTLLALSLSPAKHARLPALQAHT